VRCSQCDEVFRLESPLPSVEDGEVGAEPEPGSDFGPAFGSMDSPRSSPEGDPGLSGSEAVLEADPVAEDDFSDLGTTPSEADDSDTDSALLEDDSWALLDEENANPGDEPPAHGAVDPVAGAGQSPADTKVAIGAVALESVPAGSHRARTAPVSGVRGLTERFAAMGRGVGWGITAALVLLALIIILRETADSVGTAPQVIEVGSFRVEGLRGEWVDTMAGNTLLAVIGEIHNPSASTARLGGILEVSLVGSDGRRLVVPSEPMGLRISEQAIRELPAGPLRGAQLSAARDLAGRALLAGQSIAVQAIFMHPPADAASFELDVRAGPQGAAAD